MTLDATMLDGLDPLFPTLYALDSIQPGEYVGRIKQIQLDVCAEYGVTLIDMLSRRQSNRVNRARKTAMQRARTRTRASYPELGRAFERDHTTIMYACGATRRGKT